MKIIKLEASNVKRLKAVEINPDGTLQVVAGRNAQGKSSVLDSIWLALGGGKAGKETSRPIRDGEEKASVTLNLGELIVTRTWSGSGTKLQVTSADGAAFKSPQGMLDALVGQLSFDPLAFTRLSAREQRDSLLDLVDLDVDLDALDADRQQAYDQRTQVGRDIKAIGDVVVDDSLPAEEQSAGELISKIREEQDVEAALQQKKDDRADLSRRIEETSQQIEKLQGILHSMAEQAETLDSILETHRRPADISELEKKLSNVEDINAAIRANNDAKARKDKQDQLRARYTEYTEQIEELDQQKADALAKAEFPVEGLAFDEHGVTYQGVPFAQASSAEQIKVSLGMGMALNPKLRVLVIKDGSLLDDEAMAAIREHVAEHDFQLWIERVGNSDEGAVIIEDGQVSP